MPIAGLILRVVTYCFLDPHYVDDHFRVILWLEEHGELPAAGRINMAYHPPLYYLLAAVPWLLTDNWKVVQIFSLLFRRARCRWPRSSARTNIPSCAITLLSRSLRALA